LGIAGVKEGKPKGFFGQFEMFSVFIFGSYSWEEIKNKFQIYCLFLETLYLPLHPLSQRKHNSTKRSKEISGSLKGA